MNRFALLLLCVLLSAATLLGTTADTFADAPPVLPIQGQLTDDLGVPIDGDTELTFAIYDVGTGNLLFSETAIVAVTQGAFFAEVGAQMPLDLSVFRDYGDVELGISVGAGAEMTPRLPIGSTAYAGFAQYTAEADALAGGFTAGDFAEKGNVDWSEIQNVPSEVSNPPSGSDTLAMLSCADNELARWDQGVGSWECSIDAATDEATIDAAVANNGYALASELSDKNPATTPVTWSDISGVPADADTLGGLSCANGQLVRWNQAGANWECSDETLTDEATIDAAVANNGYALAAELTDQDASTTPVHWDDLSGVPPEVGTGLRGGGAENEVAKFDSSGEVIGSGATIDSSGNLSTAEFTSILGTYNGFGGSELRMGGFFSDTIEFHGAQGRRMELGGAAENVLLGVPATQAASGTHRVVVGGGGAVATDTPRAFDNHTVVIGGARNVAGSDDASDANSAFAVVVGGEGNISSGVHSAIMGGEVNAAESPNGGIVAGERNRVQGAHGFVGGGMLNVVRGGRAAAVGGDRNEANGTEAFVAGGTTLVANGQGSALVGGDNNRSDGFRSAVLGGRGNRARASDSAVVGGSGNSADGPASVIVGGQDNIVAPAARAGIVVGGSTNRADGVESSIVAGRENRALGQYSFLGAGRSNTARGDYTVVAGGATNDADGRAAAIVGGEGHRTSAVHAGVFGGSNHLATGVESVVVGGNTSEAHGDRSFIGGGLSALSSGIDSAVVGGANGLAEGQSSFVGGGEGNSTIGLRSSIAGGMNGVAEGEGSFVGGGEENSARAAWSSIVGGRVNVAAGLDSATVGGQQNQALGSRAFVGGGESNIANAQSASAVGGSNNQVTGISAIVAGGSGNIASAENTAVIGGAGNSTSALYAAVLGGDGNVAEGPNSAIVGGRDNRILSGGSRGFIGGGFQNTSVGRYSVIGGGLINSSEGEKSAILGGEYNRATGTNAAILGGDNNQALGIASVVMGSRNIASGFASVAMGSRAGAHTNAFVWSDGTNTTNSVGDRSFVARASGGFWLFSSPGSSGVRLPSGSGSWTSLSDRNAKTDIVGVDPEQVLDKVAALPIARWRYKSEGSKAVHMGPMAQDFFAQFGLGDGDTTISTVDADGVAIAAIQGLNIRGKASSERIDHLEKANVSLEVANAALQRENTLVRARLSDLEARLDETPKTATVDQPKPWHLGLLDSGTAPLVLLSLLGCGAFALRRGGRS